MQAPGWTPNLVLIIIIITTILIIIKNSHHRHRCNLHFDQSIFLCVPMADFQSEKLRLKLSWILCVEIYCGKLHKVGFFQQSFQPTTLLPTNALIIIALSLHRVSGNRTGSVNRAAPFKWNQCLYASFIFTTYLMCNVCCLDFRRRRRFYSSYAEKVPASVQPLKRNCGRKRHWCTQVSWFT